MRDIRYQALIVQDDRVLLIQHKEHASGREYWLLPGGGQEPGETPEACVVREVNEETHLTVRVERLLFDEPVDPSRGYLRRRTYLCTPTGGQASPGYEPESEASEVYAISRVAWFDLRVEAEWGSDLIDDPETYHQLHLARRTLGYRD
jgi:8-oxo-dGTP pyrophosphatase MutT (NUDIX family)